MRRLFFVISTALASLALLLPSGSTAITTNGYHGSTDAGGLIAFGAKFNAKGKPIRVQALRWANVPASCSGSPYQHSGELTLTMRVNRKGRFHGSKKLPIGDAKVAIAGRFKRHAKRAVGTFRLHGSIAGCSDADTGKLGWEMTKKH